MALRAECTHIASESGQTVKVELISATYGGVSREVIGTGADWVRLSYDQLDFTDLFGTVVQRGRLDFSYYVQDATDEQILTDIIAAGQGDYTLKLYINGSAYWTGEVMLDQLGAQEEGISYPYRVRLTAKDFTTLERSLFPLEDERQLIAKIAGRILNETGYGLNIWTHTSWTEDNINSANDFMRQIYANTRNLREFGKDQDLQITYLDALIRLLEPFRCIVRQEAGVFTISQWSEYDVPSAVLRTVYDADGDYVSQSSVNTTVSANDTVQVVAGSVSEFKPGYKRVLANYAHRTQISGIQVPDSVMLDETNTSDFFEQVIEINATDINQRISLNTTAFVNFDEPQTGAAIGGEPKVGVILAVTVEGVPKYWNNATGLWQGTTVTNEFTTKSKTPVGKLTELPELTYQNFVASINVTTSSLTRVNDGLSGFGTITLTLIRANTGALASETVYEGTSLVVGSANNTNTSQSIGYSLTNQANFSKNYNAGSYYFGDGPLKSSPGMLRYGTGDLQTVGNWGRRGDTPSYLFYQQNLKEVMDLYRGWNKVMTARILNVGYDTTKSLTYLTKSYNAIGGTFDGYTGWWTALVFENSLATDVTDSFDLALVSSGTALTTGAYTAARLNSQDTLERSGGYVFILASEISGTVTQVIVKNLLTEFPQLKAGMQIRVVHPITLDDFIFEVAEDMFDGSLVIQVVSATVDAPFPAGSYVYTNPGDATAALIIGRDSIRLIAESTAVGVTTSESLGSVTSIAVRLNTRVQAGDDLFLVRTLDAVKRAFTVGQTVGPGVVTLQLDQPTVFDAPAGSYIIGSNAQYEAFLQVTPAGVLAKAEAVTTQNSFAILSAPLSTGTYTGIGVTSVRTLKLKSGSVIGVQDKAGNTEFFTVDGDQDLTPATTTITVESETTSTAVGAGAGVFQPSWNQTGVLSVQADQIALRVTESEVQTLINESIAGVLPAVVFNFDNTTEGFTTNSVTLTAAPTVVEYLATGSTPYIQKALDTSYAAADNPVVTIRVQRIAGTNWGGAFGWSTDGTNFNTQTFTEPTNLDSELSFTTIDLTSNVNYTGTITHIRIYLGEANLDEFEIDQFTIGKFNPQTEILEDLSTRLTVAEGAITVEAGRIDLFTEKSQELNRIAEVTGTYNQSSSYTSITLTNIRSNFDIRDNQVLYLVNVDGTFQSVTANGNQSPLASPLAIDSVTFSTTISAGAMLYEAAFTQTSRITQAAGQIVLKAQESAGEVTSLALVRLDASAASGSAVKIQGDLVAINDIQITRGTGANPGVIQTSGFVSGSSGWRIKGDGNAEFNDVTVRGSVFVTGGDAATQTYADTVGSNTLAAAESYADDEALAARNAARNNIAAQLGYTDYDTMITAVGASGTIIANGFIRTTLIDVDELYATSATITNSLTLGTGGEIKNSSTDYLINSSGIRINAGTAGNVTAKQFSINGNYGGNANAQIGYIEGLVNVGGTLGQVRMYGATNLLLGAGTESNGIEITQSKTTVAGANQNVVYLGSGISLYASRFRVDANNATIDGTTYQDYDFLPQRALNNIYARKGQSNTFTANQTILGSLILGTNTNKATITYSTDTARTLTIPNVGGDRTFAFIDQAQELSANQTFQHSRLRVKAQSSGGVATINIQNTANNRTMTIPTTESGDFMIMSSITANSVTPDRRGVVYDSAGNAYYVALELIA